MEAMEKETDVVITVGEEGEQENWVEDATGEGEVNQGSQSFWLLEEDITKDNRPAKDMTEFSTEVSVEFLTSLGLEQYVQTVQNEGIGIEALTNMSFEVLAEYIPNPRDQALIIGRSRELKVKASPPKVDGRPVRVMAKVGLARISEVSTVDLTARLKMFIDLYWYDDR